MKHVEKTKIRDRPPETKCTKGMRVLASLALIFNFILVALVLSPHQIKHPVRQKLKSLVSPSSSSSSSSSSTGDIDISASGKNGGSGGDLSSLDPSSDSSSSSSTVSSSFDFSEICDQNSQLLLMNSTCSQKRRSLGLRATIQLCSNFVYLRSVLKPCQINFVFDNNNNNNNNNNVAPAVIPVSTLKKFVMQNNLLFSLNGTTPVHFDKLLDVQKQQQRINQVTSLLLKFRRHKQQLQHQHQRQQQEKQQKFDGNSNNNNTNIVTTVSSASTASSPPQKQQQQEEKQVKQDVSTETIQNSSLRAIFATMKRISQLEKRKSDLRLTRNTEINSKRPLSNVFVHAIADMFHSHFENRKVLVMSSLKLPTIEVAVLALSGARLVDGVNIVNNKYRTSVPAFRNFASLQDLIIMSSQQNNKQQQQQQQQQQQPQQYSVIVSYLVLQSLSLYSPSVVSQAETSFYSSSSSSSSFSFSSGAGGGVEDELDPFADFHAMNLYWNLLKPGGLLILTLPVGADCLDFNERRVYGKERLSVLFRGWSVLLTVGVSTNPAVKSGLKPCEQSSDAMFVLSRVEPSSEEDSNIF